MRLIEDMLRQAGSYEGQAAGYRLAGDRAMAATVHRAAVTLAAAAKAVEEAEAEVSRVRMERGWERLREAIEMEGQP